MQKLTLNIGKLPDGSQWLCLADADTSDVYPLARFESEDHADVFQKFMWTQGFAAVKLPSDDDIAVLLGDEDTTES